MPTRAHHRSRVAATVGAATAHAYLSLIGVHGYLDYTVATRYTLLEEVAGQHVWAWIHGAVTVILLLTLFDPYRRVRETPVIFIACSMAFAAMLIWAFFNMLWGLSTVRPVSLAGPGLALVVAAGEQLLAHAWNRGASTRDR